MDLRAALGRHQSISKYLLRDGTIFFVIVTAVDLIQIVFTASGNSDLPGADYFQPFFQAAPGLVICRFMLNLRQHYENDSSQFDTPPSLNVSPGPVPDALRSFGAPLDFRGGVSSQDDFWEDPAGSSGEVSEEIQLVSFAFAV
ncbi:hypothetical protein PsYK624_003800 [Phanerochaete sordida]|uniref:Uncharacterized protein n=1 Tax=Phanerochaete sordida TaxID=48140 RepID=A0A9P3FY20_9APHY|nr:hypothetical protein PsYK624_003800 [Phanerochaete sordida]